MSFFKLTKILKSLEQVSHSTNSKLQKVIILKLAALFYQILK